MIAGLYRTFSLTYNSATGTMNSANSHIYPIIYRGGGAISIGVISLALHWFFHW